MYASIILFRPYEQYLLFSCRVLLVFNFSVAPSYDQLSESTLHNSVLQWLEFLSIFFFNRKKNNFRLSPEVVAATSHLE